MSNGYSRTDFSESCEENKAYLYIINCYNDNENFFKIGITKHLDLKKRFGSDGIMPYKYNVVRRIESFPSIVFDLETKLHQLCNPTKYIPLISFGGEQECFTNIDTAIEYIEDITKWMSVCIDVPLITNPVLNCKGGISKINFKELCKLYIQSIEENDTITQQDIEDFSPIFLEARKIFRANLIEDITASAMQQTRLQQRITIHTQTYSKTFEIKDNLPFKVNEFYGLQDVKDGIQSTYDMLDIKKKAKSTEVEQWFNIKKTIKNGISGYTILSVK